MSHDKVVSGFGVLFTGHFLGFFFSFGGTRRFFFFFRVFFA